MKFLKKHFENVAGEGILASAGKKLAATFMGASLALTAGTVGAFGPYGPPGGNPYYTTPWMQQQPNLKTAEPRTAHSDYIREMNQKFRDAEPRHRIVIMDRDWLSLNKALNGIGEDETREMAALVNSYIQKNLGYTLPSQLAEVLADPKMAAAPNTMPFPQMGGGYSQGQGGTCVIYPSPHNEGTEARVKNLLTYSPVFYGRLYGHDPVHPATSQDYMERIDYHELSHCFDNKFMNNGGSMYSRPSANDVAMQRHKAEMFGDTLGLLLQAKFEGMTDIGPFMADASLLRNMFMGTAMARIYQKDKSVPVTKDNVFGVEFSTMPQTGHKHGADELSVDPMQALSGVIYMDTNALRATQAFIDKKGVNAIQNMSINDLRDVAYKIVDDHALSLYEMQVHYNAMKDPDYFDKVSAKRHTDPEFEDQYQILKTYLSDVERAVSRVLLQSALNDAGECRPDQDIPTVSPEQIKSILNNGSDCDSYAYPYTDISKLPTEDMLSSRKDFEKQRDEDVQKMAAVFYEEISKRGADDSVIEEIFQRNVDFYTPQLESADRDERMAAVRNLANLGNGLSAAVKQYHAERTPQAPQYQPQRVAPPPFYRPPW